MIELRPDQKDVAKKLVEMLKTHPVVGLQAPTGWGKTLTALEVIKELGVRAVWLVPRLSIGIHVFNHCNALGLRCLATAGREKMCIHGYTLEFLRGVCRSCEYNRPISLSDLRDFQSSVDFGKIRERSEALHLCPYLVQTVLERSRFDVTIAHYGRANKLIRALRPGIVIIDECHNLTLPSMHKVDTRAMEVLLGKLGFEEDEIGQIIKSPETLKMVLNEMIDALVTIAFEDNDLRPIIEEVVQMLSSQIWYFDADDETITALELPLNLSTNVPIVYMSATLPPSLGSNVITIKRGWTIPVQVDSKYVLSYENIMRKREEIGKYVSEKYLRPSTVIFTTAARELLLNNKDGVIYEDELEGRTPCDFKSETVVLRAYGRYAEGINLDCFDNLVLLGLPALQPTAMHRLEMRGVKPRDLIVVKIAQIIGRVIRSPTPPDRMPNIYLVDKRFHQFESELKNYEIEIIND